MPKYDIVVVGAGNAGLSAALQCQLAGKRTLLIEKHNVPGGAATSFVRGRFEIEPSLHELCDFGPAENPGDVRNILDAYGVKLDWYECKDCFRIVSQYSDGSPMDVTMPSGIENFISKMEEYVPESREKMVQLFDLFQEVLVNLWKSFPTFEGRSDVRTWVYRVALNVCVSLDRKKKRRKTVPLTMDVNPYEDENPNSKQMELLRKRINKLGPFDRAIIMLWLENMSYDEIGQVVGISTKNVSVRLYRIKEELKKMND